MILRPQWCILISFSVKAETFADCISAIHTVLFLFRKLGFQIDWNKVVDPTSKLIFRGIEIESVQLPGDKLAQVRQALSQFAARKHASKSIFNPLQGSLSFGQA